MLSLSKETEYYNNIKPISVGDISIHPEKNVYIAGPCAVESEEQMQRIAAAVVGMGALAIRGGAFKPRTNPEAFRGLGVEGLQYLFDAGSLHGVPVVTEVMAERQIDLILQASKNHKNHPFIFQIGARNAQNYELLSAVGKTGIPVMLKNGSGSNIKDMIGAAGYITHGGSPVIMCERGISTFNCGDPKKCAGRFTADLHAVLRFQEEGFLTIFDPSHAAGRADHVVQIALAGVGVGANGVIVEVHDDPQHALCDKDQAISFEQFHTLINTAKQLEQVMRASQFIY